MRDNLRVGEVFDEIKARRRVVRSLICASLLDGAWFCLREIQCLVICCRMERVRSDFVGNIRELMRWRFVAALAAESTISLPGIFLWLGTQMKVTDWESDELSLIHISEPTRPY